MGDNAYDVYIEHMNSIIDSALENVARYMHNGSAAPEWFTPVKIDLKEEDRPTLIDRLDKAEDKVVELEEELGTTINELNELRGQIDSVLEDNRYLIATNQAIKARLSAIDVMGHDLTKLERAIGTIRFNEIIGGK